MLIPIERLSQAQLRRLQGASRNVPTNVGRRLPSNNNTSSNVQRQIQSLSDRIADLSDKFERTQRAPASASIGSGDRTRNISGSIRNAQYGHGGVQYSDQESFAGAAIAAGTSLDIGVSGTDLNRIQDATLCDVEAIVGDELYNEAQNFSVTMYLNGDPVPSMRNVPLAWLVETLEGERQVWPVEQYLTASDDPSFRVTARNGVTFTTAQTVEFRLSAGGDCG